MSNVTNVNSSLAYEILLYLNSFYLGMFFVCETAMGILKVINVPYPENTLWTEVGIFFLLCLLEVIRIFLGRRGNLASKSEFFLFYRLKVPLAYLIIKKTIKMLLLLQNICRLN